MSADFNYTHEQEEFEPPTRAKIIKEVCARMGLRLEVLQPREGFFLRIWSGSKFINHQTNVCTVNSYSATNIAKDKSYTYLLLQRAGINIPRGDYYFRPYHYLKPDYSIGRGMNEALRDGIALGMGWTREHAAHHLIEQSSVVMKFKKSLIVKPNSLSQGKGISLVESSAELKPALDRVFRLPTDLESIVIIQEYISGKEFRLVMLDGELLLCYEKLFGGSTSNLHGGAQAIDRTNEVSKDYIDMSRLISRETQLRYLGIDFRCADITAPANEAIILEVNGNPGLTYLYQQGNTELVFEIYQKLLKLMFEETE